MPKIPLIQSQRTMPGLPSAVVQDRSGQIIGGAIESLGQTLQVAEARVSEKQAKVKGYGLETELMEASRTQYADALENKRSSDALPNEDTGYKGVFGEYDTFASDFKNKALGKIDPRYRAAVGAQLDGVAERYKDRFMAHQAQQQGVFRAETLHDNITAIEGEMATLMQAGVATLDDVQAAHTKIAELTKSESRGAKAKDFIDQKKNEMYSNAIKSIITTRPEDAKEMLQDPRVIKSLSETQQNALDEQADKELLKKSTNEKINFVMQSATKEGRRLLAADLPTETPEDKAVQKAVYAEIDYQDGREKQVKVSNQYEVFNSTYELIVDGAEGAPTSPTDIDSDPKYEALEASQREYLKNMVKSPSFGQFDPQNRVRVWGETRRKIKGRAMNEAEVMAEVMAGNIDTRDAKTLVRYAQDIAQNKDLVDGDSILKSDYLKIWKNDKQRYIAQEAIERGITGFVKRNQRDPEGEEIQNIVDLATKKVVVEDDFFYFDISKNVFKLDDDGQTQVFTEATEAAFKNTGFPDATLSPNGDVQLKAEYEGTTPTRVLILPAGSSKLSEAYWVRANGEK